jgi:hypothetical protein
LIFVVCPTNITFPVIHFIECFTNTFLLSSFFLPFPLKIAHQTDATAHRRHIARRRRDARAADALGRRMKEIDDAASISTTPAPTVVTSSSTTNSTAPPFAVDQSPSSISTTIANGGHGAQQHRYIEESISSSFYSSTSFGGVPEVNGNVPPPVPAVEAARNESKLSNGDILMKYKGTSHEWHEHHTQPIAESDYGFVAPWYDMLLRIPLLNISCLCVNFDMLIVLFISS